MAQVIRYSTPDVFLFFLKCLLTFLPATAVKHSTKRLAPWIKQCMSMPGFESKPPPVFLGLLDKHVRDVLAIFFAFLSHLQCF